jgi:outer membrane protein assembly factor BamB
MKQLSKAMGVILLLAGVSLTHGAQESAARELLEQSACQGGLIVYVGRGDDAQAWARVLAELGAEDCYLVLGLSKNRAVVTTARQAIQAKGIYGRVTVDLWLGHRLPVVDNSVNLLVCDEDIKLSAEEIERVLVPQGTALVKKRGNWTRRVKARPDKIDEWTHFLHGPDNNAVAQDTIVGLPHHVQWIGDPKWARHHNYLSSTSAVVSAKGRLFTIIDEGPTVSVDQAPQWFLTARDAFNGVVLWKRPIGTWEEHLRRFRSGPANLARRLVAQGDQVYVTLGYGEPAAALDAATGKLAKTYEHTNGAEEILLQNGILYVIAGESTGQTPTPFAAAPPRRHKRILAIQANSGRLLWKKDDADTHEILPTALCLKGERLFLKNEQGILCLDAVTGKQLWFTARASLRTRVAWGAPTLVAYKDVLLCADRIGPEPQDQKQGAQAIQWEVTSQPRGRAGSELAAYDAATGQRLWSCPTEFGYTSPTDVFVAQGLVWYGDSYGANTPTFSTGRDPRTGEIKMQLDTQAAFTETHHHRCYRNKATERFILLGRTGVEFIDLQGQTPQRHCWIRGACQYGVLPCNGLLYLPPHSCACYIQSKLTGFHALAPKRSVKSEVGRAKEEDRLVKGSAYEDFHPSPFTIHPSTDWPCFRHDAARTGTTAATLPNKLAPAWSVQLTGPLTSPVAVADTVYVAAKDQHMVHAFDANTGQEKWRFTAGGRIDSPPTIHGGRAFFGCADGWVYALRLTDGQLAWRFRAAPVDQRIVVRGQLESVWPVTGSVLIHNDRLLCTAGRSSFLDGGMSLIHLDPATGRKLAEHPIYSRDPETGEQQEEIIDDVELPGAQPDVLVCTGDDLFLRDRRMDLSGNELPADVPHLYSPVGFLDDHWWHRTYWIYGTQTFGRAAGWHVVANHVPSGRIMVQDQDTVFGFGRIRVRSHDRGLQAEELHLFRSQKKLKPGKAIGKNNNTALMKRLQASKVSYLWTQAVPVAARAMVLTPNCLIIAGPNLEQGKDEPRFKATEPAQMIVVASETGQPLAKYPIPAQPVLDGMIVARHRVYMATQAGTVECWAAPQRNKQSLSEDVPLNSPCKGL